MVRFFSAKKLEKFSSKRLKKRVRKIEGEFEEIKPANGNKALFEKNKRKAKRLGREAGKARGIIISRELRRKE